MIHSRSHSCRAVESRPSCIIRREKRLTDSFQNWFGSGNNPNELQGLFDRIVSGDKGNVSFTCDDVDQYVAPSIAICFIVRQLTSDSLCDGKYGVITGYFSPSVPELTVVCSTYYLAKSPLNELCTAGQTIASQGSECQFHFHLPPSIHALDTPQSSIACNALRRSHG